MSNHEVLIHVGHHDRRHFSPLEYVLEINPSLGRWLRLHKIPLRQQIQPLPEDSSSDVIVIRATLTGRQMFYYRLRWQSK